MWLWHKSKKEAKLKRCNISFYSYDYFRGINLSQLRFRIVKIYSVPYIQAIRNTTYKTFRQYNTYNSFK